MRSMCHRLQWDEEDLDWGLEPRPLERDDEIAIVQYFTDMVGIERLAGELFRVQRDRSEDPVLREIFDSFVIDELRHSRVAARLARHYDVHRYKVYRRNRHLVRFERAFVEALEHLSPEIGNAYIMVGELLLDVALLRSIDDFVNDEMSAAAMKLINRDESRHIAIDFHMVEYYASAEHAAREASRPRPPILERARGALALGRVFLHVAPFFREVFFEPMTRVDPSGRRLREAFKRAQLVGVKEEVLNRPFSRFLDRMRRLFEHPITGRLFGPAIARVIGLDPSLIVTLYDEEEAARFRAMSLDEMAEDAVQAKYLN